MPRIHKPLQLLFVTMLAAAAVSAIAQDHPAGRAAKLGPMLDEGLISFQSPELGLRLVRSSGTVAALEPNHGDGFDFTPAELLAARSTDGYDHLGDLDLRVRVAGTTEWRGYSTAIERHPVHSLPAGPGELRRDDLRPTLPADFPLQLTRSWAVVNGKLALLRYKPQYTWPGLVFVLLGIPVYLLWTRLSPQSGDAVQ